MPVESGASSRMATVYSLDVVDTARGNWPVMCWGGGREARKLPHSLLRISMLQFQDHALFQPLGIDPL